jgi:hypothetical protein
MSWAMMSDNSRQGTAAVAVQVARGIEGEDFCICPQISVPRGITNPKPEKSNTVPEGHRTAGGDDSSHLTAREKIEPNEN